MHSEKIYIPKNIYIKQKNIFRKIYLKKWRPWLFLDHNNWLNFSDFLKFRLFKRFSRTCRNPDKSNEVKKKVDLFLEIGRVNFFYHLPARISRMCMRIYIFLFQKIRTQTKKFPLANLFVRIYVFLSLPLFFNQEKCYQSSSFKCKRYLKNSIKLIKKKSLRPSGWGYFSSPAFPQTIVIFFLFWGKF